MTTPDPMSTADTVNTLGAGAMISLVVLVLLMGFFSLAGLASEWWRDRTAATTFVDQHIPTNEDVLAIERDLPKMKKDMR